MGWGDRGDIEKKKKGPGAETVGVHNEDFCMTGETFVNK